MNSPEKAVTLSVALNERCSEVCRSSYDDGTLESQKGEGEREREREREPRGGKEGRGTLKCPGAMIHLWLRNLMVPEMQDVGIF